MFWTFFLMVKVQCDLYNGACCYFYYPYMLYLSTGKYVVSSRDGLVLLLTVTWCAHFHVQSYVFFFSPILKWVCQYQYSHV